MCSDFDETITNRLEMVKSGANLVSDKKVDKKVRVAPACETQNLIAGRSYCPRTTSEPFELPLDSCIHVDIEDEVTTAGRTRSNQVTTLTCSSLGVDLLLEEIETYDDG